MRRIVNRVVNNLILHPTKRYIQNWDGDFTTTDGPHTTSTINLKDLGIPYDSHYVARLVLPAQTYDYELKYNSLSAITFLLIKVTYNDNYDNAMEDSYDPLYYYEESNYNIEYYYEGNSGITYPIGRMLLLNSSFTNKLTKIFLNNPLDYDVVLDVLHADIGFSPSTFPPTPTSSASTITNLYYTDITTDQISCTYQSVSYTGSTQLIISEYYLNATGYTIIQNLIPYDEIISVSKSDTLKNIYIITASDYYTLKFLTDNDFNQGYARIMFAYNSYLNGTCRFLTTTEVYENDISISCLSGTTGINNTPPIIYYNPEPTGVDLYIPKWDGSGTTTPTNVYLYLEQSPSGWTADSLKYLFISGITDCFDDIQITAATFTIYKEPLKLSEDPTIPTCGDLVTYTDCSGCAGLTPIDSINEEGIFNIYISVSDNANNTTTDEILDIKVSDSPPVIAYKYDILDNTITGSTSTYDHLATGITSGITIYSGFTLTLTGFSDDTITRIDIIDNAVSYVYDLVDTLNKYMLHLLIMDLTSVKETITTTGLYCIKFYLTDSAGNTLEDYLMLEVI